MRRNHIMRSFTLAAAVPVILMLLAAGSGLAFTIQSPTEGQVVRGQVPIIVPRSSLPSDVTSSGFLAIKINGKFVAAVGAVEEPAADNTPASPNVVYLWDSKALSGDSIRGDAKPFADGSYDIVIEAHSVQSGAKDAIVETSKVNVTLKNKVDLPNPAPPIMLRYRYPLGQITRYKFSTAGEVYDRYGFSLSGGQPPILGDFTVIQYVEDPRRDGTALLRYKVDKDTTPYTQVLGQVAMLGQTQKFRSIYRILDGAARVLEANVFSTKQAGDVTDCLVPLPGNAVNVGANWPAAVHMKVEGLTDGADLTGSCTLASVEWENNMECAKITSDMSGTMLVPSIQNIPVTVKCTGTAYYAYKINKLIKNVYNIEFSATMDDATIATLQSPPSSTDSTSLPPITDNGGAPTVGGPGAGGTQFLPPAVGGPLAGGYRPTVTTSPGYYGTTGGTTGATTPGGTQVKVKLTVTQELVGK